MSVRFYLTAALMIALLALLASYLFGLTFDWARVGVVLGLFVVAGFVIEISQKKKTKHG